MIDKGQEFRALHRPGDPFVLANASDAGSAKMLEAMGARAIATSSAALGFTLGKPDGHITRDEALAHAETLVSAVNLPVSGDFENGYGDDPGTVAETVRLAAEVGLAGICIEDTRLAAGACYDAGLAAERIKAAVAAARALPRDFFLVARADGVMMDLYDLDEALARVRAFDAAGADGIYIPLPKHADDFRRITAAVHCPVNALAAGPHARIPLARFAEMGVARISLGSALARVTHRAIHDAAQAIFDHGDFSLLADGLSARRVDAMLSGGG